MALTQSQRAIWQKARSLGASQQQVRLTDEMCAYLVARIAADMALIDEHFPELNEPIPELFTKESLTSLTIDHVDAKALFERLVESNSDCDTYFACLAALHKSRLKYERVLSTQPFPTLDQVGPRGLLQYGTVDARALVGFLFWRKWFYDIDNRAAQDTGYLFEPIIAHAIGGTPAPARRSPVKRATDNSKGRQVDCILDERAYELKIRVTIAASGQGRWQEELDFPRDARHSGYTPVLVCMDGTSNPKLDALIAAFHAADGEVFVGDAAWEHLESMAGDTMSEFLERYVRAPIQRLIATDDAIVPDLTATWSADAVTIALAGDSLQITRDTSAENVTEDSTDPMPDDADEEIPG